VPWRAWGPRASGSPGLGTRFQPSRWLALCQCLVVLPQPNDCLQARTLRPCFLANDPSGGVFMPNGMAGMAQGPP